MKKIILALLVSVWVMPSFAQKTKWTLDNSHSKVTFSVTHMLISEVEGKFKTYDGTFSSTSDDFNNSEVTFTIDVNSVDTDNEMRDKHLKGDDFFNAEKYPKMTFTSTSFKKTGDKKYVLEGNLTIRDVTKKVKLDVSYNGTVKDPWGNIKAGFKVTGSINRKDYGLKWNTLTEAGGAVVSDEVAILVNLELAKAKN